MHGRWNTGKLYYSTVELGYHYQQSISYVRVSLQCYIHIKITGKKPINP
jgi:hypothetical protein